MRIIAQIHYYRGDLWDQLLAKGIILDEKYNTTPVIRIPVTDPVYEKLKNSGVEFAEKRFAYFTKPERDRSSYLKIMPSYAWTETLHAANKRAKFFRQVCQVCLARDEQVEDVRMQVSLGKQYDLFTVPLPEMLFIRGHRAKQVFTDFGCDFRSLRTPKGRPIEDAWQVVTPLAESPLLMTTPPARSCPLCGTKAYQFPYDDYAPSFQSDPGSGPRLTQEWFANFEDVFRFVYVPNALARAIKQAGLKHATFRPQNPACNVDPL
ncbi:MAG: hypothetical protein JSS65_06110 [Armatimonadetes bacterium]|nr:hypothetical protein [Armatimonadota bacterium]